MISLSASSVCKMNIMFEGSEVSKTFLENSFAGESFSFSFLIVRKIAESPETEMSIQREEREQGAASTLSSGGGELTFCQE